MATLPPSDGSIDFEDTDLADARRALAIPPAGVEQVQRLRPGYWEERRRAPVASDRAMTGATLDWVIALPAEARPTQLCDQFSRVANSIAAVWKDRITCLAYLNGLLVDRRDHRRGFPVIVRHEIEQLIDYRRRQAE